MLRDQRFGLAAQDLGFRPIMEVKPEFLFSMRRDSATELIVPLLGLAEPAARFLGLPKALVGQGPTFRTLGRFLVGGPIVPRFRRTRHAANVGRWDQRAPLDSSKTPATQSGFGTKRRPESTDDL
jgi:hypothetical protein